MRRIAAIIIVAVISAASAVYGNEEKSQADEPQSIYGSVKESVRVARPRKEHLLVVPMESINTVMTMDFGYITIRTTLGLKVLTMKVGAGAKGNKKFLSAAAAVNFGSGFLIQATGSLENNMEKECFPDIKSFNVLAVGDFKGWKLKLGASAKIFPEGRQEPAYGWSLSCLVYVF